MYLLGALAMAAERTGLVAGPDQVYDFTISPVLGGPASRWRGGRPRARGRPVSWPSQVLN